MNKSMSNRTQIYNELRLIYDIKAGKRIIVDKRPTERGIVSIDYETAEIMNSNSERSGIVYELREVIEPKKDDKEYRKELFAKAKELGIEHAKNIKTEDLQKLIEE